MMHCLSMQSPERRFCRSCTAADRAQRIAVRSQQLQKDEAAKKKHLLGPSEMDRDKAQQKMKCATLNTYFPTKSD